MRTAHQDQTDQVPGQAAHEMLGETPIRGDNDRYTKLIMMVLTAGCSGGRGVSN